MIANREQGQILFHHMPRVNFNPLVSRVVKRFFFVYCMRVVNFN